jgi:hypothetical protein
MVRVLLNYLDMRLNGLTAFNASEGSNIDLAIHITEMRHITEWRISISRKNRDLSPTI